MWQETQKPATDVYLLNLIWDCIYIEFRTLVMNDREIDTASEFAAVQYKL